MAEQDPQKTLTERQREVYDELPLVLPSELDLDELGDVLMQMTIPQRMALTKKVRFLRAYAVRGNMRDGLKAAGVSYETVHRHWRRTDPWFEKMMAEALLEAVDVLEAEAHRRAVTGVDEPVIYQGMVTTVFNPKTGLDEVLTVKKYSDGLLQMLLKASDPEKYRDQSKQTVEHKGAVGVLVVPGAASDLGAWEAHAAQQQERFARNTGERPAIEHGQPAAPPTTK